MFNVVLRISWIGDLKSVSREFEPTTLDFVYDALLTEPDIAMYICGMYLYIYSIYIQSMVYMWYAYGIQGRGFKSHSGQLSIWNRKTLAQNEYHIYRQIPLHTHDYLTN